MKPFLREKVDGKKIITDGFEFQLDYNEHRMVEFGRISKSNDQEFDYIIDQEKIDALIYIETLVI